MHRLVIVVEDPGDWRKPVPTEGVVSAEDYLLQGPGDDNGRTQVVNLCRGLRYLGAGYYVSLLAEARGHHVIPSVRTLNSLAQPGLFLVDTEELDENVQKAIARHAAPDATAAEVTLLFGQAAEPALQELGRRLFELFPCPILRAAFRKGERWQIESLQPGALEELGADERTAFGLALESYGRKVWRRPRQRRRFRYDLAVLHDPQEKFPPSNKRALRLFLDAADDLDLDAELITREDYARLGEYDALFIRETTAVPHHTYRFAKRAEAEGLVVMDDPQSILRCTNKVYLAELLRTEEVATPRTVILSERMRPAERRAAVEAIGYPLVLKIPDGSFSRGVQRVDSTAALDPALDKLFADTALVLAQEYVYTPFDWRLGILNGRPLYACKYYMSRGHWQVYRHTADATEGGDFETLPVSRVPASVRRLAVKAAGLIGDGIYGVDLKEIDGKAMVIEVNDNPSIDAGIEDAFLGGDLYHLVMAEFLRRLELLRWQA